MNIKSLEKTLRHTFEEIRDGIIQVRTSGRLHQNIQYISKY